MRTSGRSPSTVVVIVAVVLSSFSAPASAKPAVDPPPTMVTVGDPFAPTSVAPPPTSPLMQPVPVKRDCGFSVELTGGRSLWIFCDSTNVDANRKFTWFFQNTVAFAYDDAPTTMREATDSKGRPYQFIEPDPSYTPCVGEFAGDRHVIWPTSATRVPGPYGRDRVLVWYTNYCYETGSGTLVGFVPVSMGLADLFVDPVEPAPHEIRQKARILNPNLWAIPEGDDGWFGEAATFGFDGYVYLYRCDEWLPGCQVARASYLEANDPAAYRYWDGAGDWVAAPVADAATLPVAGSTPEQSFNVVYLDDWDVWALGAMATPGIYSTKVSVRVGRTPTGPFGTPVHIEDALDCADQPSCYAGHVHSQLSSIDTLGVTVYDLHHYHERGGQVRAFGARVYLDPPPAGVCYSGFPDVRTDHGFCKEIRWFGQQGITTGYADGTYRPGATVTRQHMAAWFYRAAGSPAGPFPDPGFSDVGPTSVFYEEISWFAQQNITTGFSDGTYRPNMAVSRQSMAAWFYRWYGRPGGSFPDPGFTDVTPTSIFYREISWFAQQGITTGFPDGTYGPLLPLRRQSMAAFFYRAMGPG